MAKTEKRDFSHDNFNSTAELAVNPGFESTLSISSKDVKEEDKKYNPFEHRQLEHPNSTVGSIVHLLKACLGSGILAMPSAFKNAGLVAGSIGTIIAGFVCTHAIHMLVKTSQDLCVDAKKPFLGYADTCGAAFTYGPKKLQKYGETVKTIVDYSMFMTYITILCVYVIFIGSSFKEVFDEYTVGHELSIEIYCALTLVPLVLLCQIRNLKHLVPFTLIANILIVIVFAITMYFIFSDLPSITESDREMVASVTHWPKFFSTVLFAMEGIGVVMPVENEMAKPQQFLSCPGVLNVSMSVVILLYGVFGFFGYVKYGDVVKGSITLNLPQGSWIAQSAQILMAVVIYLTYALQFYVNMEMINRMLEKKQNTKYYNLTQVSIRILLVTISVVIAAAIPNLEVFINLVGAIFLSTLGLLIPAIINTVYRWDRGLGPWNFILYKNIIVGLISLFALFSGSYVSIQDIIHLGSDSPVEDTGNFTLNY